MAVRDWITCSLNKRHYMTTKRFTEIKPSFRHTRPRISFTIFLKTAREATSLLHRSEDSDAARTLKVFSDDEGILRGDLVDYLLAVMSDAYAGIFDGCATYRGTLLGGVQRPFGISQARQIAIRSLSEILDCPERAAADSLRGRNR
jgi:hypothetical protein